MLEGGEALGARRKKPRQSHCPLLTPGASRRAPRTWLFDLDDTLHNASRHIFPQIGRSMMAYICEYLVVDEIEATRLRQQYWLR